ncbi:FMN-dependent alpha-hydroxy acid dehydrogenase [Sistotremastrum niveocremeum HHB9708]|uniref:L-lactate dehydrogenase (cytochrome) n=1 Tax=Sistotremastrum niveocremeum HHB9708 TaxID=1314777 RepID=A0A164N6K6_9AGAM|nr:FMN-dependent alpha-hydroxy acid dehydrogenase [Sistotremastrum niveocremeum HHB9708]
MLSSADIEDVAMKVLPRKARSYYASGGDDGISLRENARAFSRFFFKPRVLRKVSQCDPSTTILGHKSSIPVYISFAGLAKLAHPNGDLNFTRSAGRTGIIQMVGTNPSFSHAEIAAARLTPQQSLFLQLYKNPDNEIAKRFVHRAEQLGYKAIFLTVDAPVLGNRETDIKAPFEEEDEEREGEPLPSQDEEIEAGGSEGGVASAFSKQDDADKTWEETIPWLHSITKLPIVVKGIQCVEDALLAAEAGVDGIVLSNHGGRQLDYAPPSIETLYQLRLQHPEVFEKLEVFIDGGVRRGTDVLKALCLGAKAVGMGRPFNYANSAYGEAGVVKLIRIMEREIVTGMRLLGAARVSDLTPEMVMRVDFHSKL